jgi:peptidoglycan/LPS O-acetylase OafA/YrhL
LLRFKALTGFRFLAASLVFVYHNRKYWQAELPPQLFRFFNEMHIGVALFFVLSGFLIAYTYNDEPMHSGKAYARYILLRLARIVPLYWLILTAFYLDAPFGHRQFTWLTYSLAHGFSSSNNLDAIAQAWSLNVELTFYFLAPLLCLLQRKHWLWLLSALIILFGMGWLTGYIWHNVNGNPRQFFYPLQFISTGIFPGRCLEFLAGMVLASAIRNNKTSWLQKMRFKTIAGFGGIVLVMYGISLVQSSIYDDGSNHPLGILLYKIALPFFVLLCLAGLIDERTWLQRFFSSPPLLLLGNASFAFYLVHISYVSIKIRGYFLLPDRNFIVLWLISILLYLVFEKPIYDLCRKWLKKEGRSFLFIKMAWFRRSRA